MTYYGYCFKDGTELVEDVEFNEEFKQFGTYTIIDNKRILLSNAMVKCPLCGLSWHADNPYIHQKPYSPPPKKDSFLLRIKKMFR